MKESKNLEFKLTLTNTFLKTVSAFSNYNSGEIIFGIADNGEIKGLEGDIDNLSLDLENKINDNINPKPEYTIVKNEKNKTIILFIEEGLNKPYLYKGKAYKRNDTSTVEVDRIELNRLTLQGLNQYYEEIKAKNQKLKFSILEKELEEKINIKKLSEDTLKTLNLFDEKIGYNNAAEIIADINSFPGVDIAKFGETIDEIVDRYTFDKMSIILQFQNTLEVFRRYYKYEKIEKIDRIEIEKIPEKAFREVIANALIHRTWDVNSNIRISMFEDKIEVVSPGGLPFGISEKEYLNGQFSQLRNPILGNIFFRLKYIEMFGTGIKRIVATYKNYDVKPIFEIYDNSIKVILPVVEVDFLLTSEEAAVFNVMKKGSILSNREIMDITGLKKDKNLKILKQLLEKRYIYSIGKGRGIKYYRK